MTTSPTTGKERAQLRAEANRLTATVHVGHQGADDSAVRSLDDVLRHVDLPRAVGSTLSDCEYPYRWSHTAG